MNEKLKTRKTELNPLKGTWTELDTSRTSHALAYNANGTLLAIGGNAGCISIWNVTSIRTVVTTLDPRFAKDISNEMVQHLKSIKKVTCISWSPDSKWIYAGYWHHQKYATFGVYNVQEGTLVHSHLVGGKVKGIVRFPYREEVIISYEEELDPSICDVVNMKSTRITLYDDVMAFLLVHDPTGASGMSASKSRSFYSKVAFSKNGRFMYFACTKGYIASYDVGSMRLLHAACLTSTMRFPDIQLNASGTLLIVPTIKGILAYNTNPTNAHPVPLSLYKTYSVSAIRSTTWVSCGFVADSTIVVGVPDSNHVHVGEKSIYSWDAASSRLLEDGETLKEGISIMIAHPSKKCVVACSNLDNVFVLEDVYKSEFAGQMYPPGFVLIPDNVVYDEPETEFDIVPDINVDQDHETLIDIFTLETPVYHPHPWLPIRPLPHLNQSEKFRFTSVFEPAPPLSPTK